MTSSTEGEPGTLPRQPAGSAPGFEIRPPVLGRASPASSASGRLAEQGDAAVAGYRAGGGDSELLSLRAATVAGVRHRLGGAPGEDDYAWGLVDTGESEILVVTVADGVGAATRAAEAAHHAVGSARRRVLEELSAGGGPGADLCVAAVTEANLVLLDLAGDTASMATTLVLAVVEARRDDDGLEAWLARVGDSTAMALGTGGWEELFGVEDDGGLASTATRALPDLQPAVEVARCRLSGGEALIMLTDGVANPLRDGPATVAPLLAATLQVPPTPLSLAAVADFERQGCHDDRTILGVWRRAATGLGAGPASF